MPKVPARHVLLVAKSCHEATALVVALLGDALRKLPELVQVDDGLVGVLVALLLDFPVDILNELLMPLDLLANTFIVLVAPLLNLLLQNSQQPLLLFAWAWLTQFKIVTRRNIPLLLYDHPIFNL